MLTKDTNMNQPKELKERKPTRLKNFDYSTTASYFITICTENRKNILSKIVGRGLPSRNYHSMEKFQIHGFEDYLLNIRKYPLIAI